MAPRMFHRLLIANRGEVAARIARTCDELGITPVFAVSQADKDAPYTKGRETILLGEAASAKSYLDLARVVQAGRQKDCSAVHPGWGFLSENPRFAALCGQHGMTFIGPAPHVMQLMGTKSPAKKAMKSSGLRTIPGSDGVLPNAEAAEAVAKEIGYPVLLKAESGGGGRGMRVVRSADEMVSKFQEASAEAMACFGDPRVYLEKLIEGGRHIEVQLMGDNYGHAVHLGERDCTVQRNHQKLIEESPAPTLSDEMRRETLEAAVRATIRIGYSGAGTMEFLIDDAGTPRFMEMNTRLQVEHSVTEMRCGLDLVAEQIRVAAGNPLSWTQDDIKLRGHAIECRINAEDPSDGFRPSPGTLNTWQPPATSQHIRVDTHVTEGYTVPPHYDSLLCKVIAWGDDRNTAIDHLDRALGELKYEGVSTNVPMHRKVLTSAAFRDNDYDTRAIPGWPASEGGQS